MRQKEGACCLKGQSVCSEIGLENTDNVLVFDFFSAPTGPTWSSGLVLLCWSLCSCSTSSSLDATHLKTLYSSVISTQLKYVHWPTYLQCISKCWSLTEGISTRFTQWFRGKAWVVLYSVRPDFTWYVESCLGRSRSWSLDLCEVRPTLCRLRTVTVLILT